MKDGIIPTQWSTGVSQASCEVNSFTPTEAEYQQ